MYLLYFRVQKKTVDPHSYPQKTSSSTQLPECVKLSQVLVNTSILQVPLQILSFNEALHATLDELFKKKNSKVK